jgi:hypothetical protein
MPSTSCALIVSMLVNVSLFTSLASSCVVRVRLAECTRETTRHTPHAVQNAYPSRFRRFSSSSVVGTLLRWSTQVKGTAAGGAIDCTFAICFF